MNALNLPVEYAVVELPVNAIEATITATVYVDGGIQKVENTMDMGAIRKAFEEAKNGYIPEDAVFMLTEKGRAMLDD